MLDIQAAASSLIAQRQSGAALSLLPELRPHDLETAYRIQARIEAMRPERSRAGGYKISCMREVSQQRFGVAEPVISPIARDRIFDDGAGIARSRYDLGFECEIAARVRLSAGGELEIVAMMASLEIIEQRYTEVSAAGFPTMVADSLYGAGCVLGAAHEDWNRLDLANAQARVVVDGVETIRRRVHEVIGDPRRSIAALITHARSDRVLQSGMVLLTGSLCGEIWVEPGQRVTCDIDGLGTASAIYDAAAKE